MGELLRSDLPVGLLFVVVLKVLLLDLEPLVPQAVDDRPGPGPPRLLHLLQVPTEGFVGRVDGVREEMKLLPLQRHAELDPVHEPEPRLLGGLPGRGQPRDRVVVGDGQDAEPPVRRLPDEIAGRKATVRPVGVGVQIRDDRSARPVRVAPGGTAHVDF